MHIGEYMNLFNLQLVAALMILLGLVGCSAGDEELEEARQMARRARALYETASRNGEAAATLRLAYEYQSDSPVMLSDRGRSLVMCGKLMERAARQDRTLAQRFVQSLFPSRYLSAKDLLKESRSGHGRIANGDFVRVQGHRLPAREFRVENGAILKAAQELFKGESEEDRHGGWDIPLVVKDGIYQVQISCRLVESYVTIPGREVSVTRQHIESYTDLMVIGRFFRDETGMYIRDPIVVNGVFGK